MKPITQSICSLVVCAVALSGLARAGTQAPPPMTTAPAADTSGFYSAIKGGVFWLQDESFGFGPYDVDVNFDTGWGITAIPIGYQVCEGFSISLSAGFYQAEIDQVEIHGRGLDVHADVGGEANFVPLMANAVCRVPLIGRLAWYAGAGLGAVYSDLDIDTVGGTRVDASASDWEFGFQAFSGFSFEVCPISDVQLGYRYLHVVGDEEDHQGHAIELGVLIRW